MNKDWILTNSSTRIKETLDWLFSQERPTPKMWVDKFIEMYEKYNNNGYMKPKYTENEWNIELDINMDVKFITDIVSRYLGSQHKDVMRHYVWKQTGVLFEIQLMRANSHWETTNTQIDYHYNIDFIDRINKKLIQVKYTKHLTIKRDIERMNIFKSRYKNFKDYDINIIWKQKGSTFEETLVLSDKEALKYDTSI